jgi:serine protease Do
LIDKSNITEIIMKKKISLFCSKLRLGILAGLLLALSASAVNDWAKGEAARKDRPRPTLKINDQPLQREAYPVVSFAPVVQEVSPSVVQVYTTTRTRPSNGRPQDPMQQLFGFPGWNQFAPPQDATPKKGLGSGVIVSPEGYVITNHHVVEGADEVKVVLNPNEETYIAEIIGTDPKSDLAVLKIDADGLVPIELGDSNQLMVGDLVMAIGNPFGVGQTVTMGMVSAKGRAEMGLDYEDFIQTDAAINPGNSGGALVDAKGRLVGINTAILSRSGGNMGIGFAIPMNLARHVMESLVEHGQVVRGYLGVSIQDVTQEMQDYLDLPAKQGALVADVFKDSPAASAGLKPGDVVTQFDGKPVGNHRELKLIIGQSQPGENYGMEILRQGEKTTLQVELATLGSDPRQPLNVSSVSERYAWMQDLDLEELTPLMRRQFDVPNSISGVLVTEVRPGSAAWETGLRAGVVINEINRKPVERIEDLRASSAMGQSILLRIWYNGQYAYRVLSLEDRG